MKRSATYRDIARNGVLISAAVAAQIWLHVPSPRKPDIWQAGALGTAGLLLFAYATDIGLLRSVFRSRWVAPMSSPDSPSAPERVPRRHFVSGLLAATIGYVLPSTSRVLAHESEEGAGESEQASTGPKRRFEISELRNPSQVQDLVNILRAETTGLAFAAAQGYEIFWQDHKAARILIEDEGMVARYDFVSVRLGTDGAIAFCPTIKPDGTGIAIEPLAHLDFTGGVYWWTGGHTARHPLLQRPECDEFDCTNSIWTILGAIGTAISCIGCLDPFPDPFTCAGCGVGAAGTVGGAISELECCPVHLLPCEAYVACTSSLYYWCHIPQFCCDVTEICYCHITDTASSYCGCGGPGLCRNTYSLRTGLLCGCSCCCEDNQCPDRRAAEAEGQRRARIMVETYDLSGGRDATPASTLRRRGATIHSPRGTGSDG